MANPAGGESPRLWVQRAALLLGVLPFPGAGWRVKDAGVTTRLLISRSDPVPLCRPQWVFGRSLPYTFFLHVKLLLAGFYGPVGSLKPVS